MITLTFEDLKYSVGDLGIGVEVFMGQIQILSLSLDVTLEGKFPLL